MRLIRGWSKNPNPPRIVVDLHAIPVVRFENVTTDDEDGILLAKGLSALSNGDMRRNAILALQKNSIPNSQAILDYWILLEQQRRKEEVEGPAVSNEQRFNYIKPSDVIKRALASASNEEG